MGFNGFYFGRLDYQDKDNRLNETVKGMEFFWNPNQNSKIENSILGIVNYNLY